MSADDSSNIRNWLILNIVFPFLVSAGINKLNGQMNFWLMPIDREGQWGGGSDSKQEEILMELVWSLGNSNKEMETVDFARSIYG